MAKMSSLAKKVREKGRVSLPEGAFLLGVSFKYYRYDVLPYITNFYDDLRREGTDLVTIAADVPEAVAATAAGGNA